MYPIGTTCALEVELNCNISWGSAICGGQFENRLKDVKVAGRCVTEDFGVGDVAFRTNTR